MESVTKSPDDKKAVKASNVLRNIEKNLINQAVNLLAELFDFEDDVTEVRLEKLRRLGRGESKNKSRKLQAFNYADLRHKLERKCQERSNKCRAY